MPPVHSLANCIEGIFREHKRKIGDLHRIVPKLKISQHRQRVARGHWRICDRYFGGKERNKHSRKRHRKWSPSEGKSIVAGVRDRSSKQISAAVVERANKETLQGFVLDRTEETATVYTDDGTPYGSLGKKRRHESIDHKAGEYVPGDVTTNGLEGFWSLLKRSYHGTFHHLSSHHLHRHVAEFSGRQNIRDLDTIDMMAVLACGIVGKRLRYRDLVAR